MLDVLLYVLPVIVVIAGAFLLYSLYPAAFPAFLHHPHRPNEGVIKRDWVATGRIDFAAQITKIKTNPGDMDQPTEFKLLVEERRIVESIAGDRCHTGRSGPEVAMRACSVPAANHATEARANCRQDRAWLGKQTAPLAQAPVRCRRARSPRTVLKFRGKPKSEHESCSGQ